MASRNQPLQVPQPRQVPQAPAPAQQDGEAPQNDQEPQVIQPPEALPQLPNEQPQVEQAQAEQTLCKMTPR